ncbi:acyltransferase family protein [Cereibacter sediminicola]|uniref:acyltransferase family protein n=1 Tax=Cereibacter sediminicola TaxID=2584941 RepID=UPI001643410E|nr:acyltransferase [Cereibacter sediminicola]
MTDDHISWDRLIDSPLTWILLVGLSTLMSGVLVSWVPAIRRTLGDVDGHRIVPLDGLRGFLGVSVLAHHAVATWNDLQTGEWALPTSRFMVHTGQSSVALFFMITAFLFWGRVIDRGGGMDWGRFYAARVFRLYPVYLLALAVVLLASLAWAAIEGRHGPVARPLLKWLAMLGSPDLLGVESARVVAGVTWTLRYEWMFCMALPVLALLAGGRALAAAGASALLLAVLFLAVPGVIDPGIALSFLGGMAAVHLVRVPILGRFARSAPGALCGVTALLCVVTLSDSGFGLLPTLGLGIFFVILAAGNTLFGLLARPSLLWLGEITYSIYLFHGVFLWLMSLPLQGRPDGALFTALLIPVSLLVIVAASLVFLLLERPGIQAGRRFKGLRIGGGRRLAASVRGYLSRRWQG